jgi:UDP-glucose 4-epimerase
MKPESRPEIAGSTVLVVGGAGFIGSLLVDELLMKGAREVVILDNMFLGFDANVRKAIAKGATLYRDNAEESDVLRYIFEKRPVDIVFNCATKALNYSFDNPAGAFDTNVAVILNLLEFQRAGAYNTLCHFSSSEVYGSAVYEPMDEEHPRNPTTTYAAGKAAADIALQTWVRMFDLDAFIVRPFNNYGPRQNYRGPLAGVIPATVRRIASGEKPILHGDGEQTRDFIFAPDTVDAVLKLFNTMEAGDSVNISTDGQIAIRDVVTRICGLLGYKGDIERRQSRRSDVQCHNASNAKMRERISFSPTPFDEGLKRTVDWYVARFTREESL